ESSAKTYGSLSEKGIEPHSDEWKAGITEVITRQSAAMASRLFPEIPRAKYLCFYPMDRKRDEQKNWYELPMADRQRMMHEHGMIGRRYADCVRQIISGSIGFDEVSAVYALFGTFYVGIRVAAADLAGFLAGDLKS